MSRIVLGDNQYGKAEVRLVRIVRGTPQHVVQDVSVTSQLRGDFAASHLHGDNSHVIATDTQKNTVFALAREHGFDSIEELALRLAGHFTREFTWVTGGRWAVEQYAWQRIDVDGVPHDHSFVRDGGDVRTTVVAASGDRTWVVSGLRDLVVLKSTGSQFSGFPRDRFTTLAETDDRVLATSVTARWRYSGDLDAIDWNATYGGVRQVLLSTFASTHSLALQQTLYAMGSAVLEAHPQVAEIRLSMPNKHHFVVDLSPFGLDNPGEVLFAADRPYGLIEGTVTRDDAPDAGTAWDAVRDFC